MGTDRPKKMSRTSFFAYGHKMYGLWYFFSNVRYMIMTQHSHIYLIFTSNFIFWVFFFFYQYSPYLWLWWEEFLLFELFSAYLRPMSCIAVGNQVGVFLLDGCWWLLDVLSYQEGFIGGVANVVAFVYSCRRSHSHSCRMRRGQLRHAVVGSFHYMALLVRREEEQSFWQCNDFIIVRGQEHKQWRFQLGEDERWTITGFTTCWGKCSNRVEVGPHQVHCSREWDNHNMVRCQCICLCMIILNNTVLKVWGRGGGGEKECGGGGGGGVQLLPSSSFTPYPPNSTMHLWRGLKVESHLELIVDGPKAVALVLLVPHALVWVNSMWLLGHVFFFGSDVSQHSIRYEYLLWAHPAKARR